MKNKIINNNLISYFCGIFLFSSLFFPIMNENISFAIFISLIIFFIFFHIIFEINFLTVIIFFFLFSLNFLNFYKIEENHNIFIPNNLNKTKYLSYLNQEDYSTLEKQFFTNYNVINKSCEKNDSSCWQNLKINNGIGHNLSFFYKNKKNSRLISSIDHNNLATIKINEINNLNLNFYKKNIFSRNNMPYFTIYKFPKWLNNSDLCFKGSVILDGLIINHQDKKCLNVNHKKKYLFYNFNFLEVELKKNLKGLIFSNFFLIFKILVIFLFYKRSYFNKNEFLNKIFIIFFSTISFLYFFYRRNDFVFGYHALDGGMDGLLHESFAKSIFINFMDGNLLEAFRGNEDVYYFMPGMRYFLFLEKLMFGNNFYLIYSVMIFMPLSLYVFFKIYFKKKISFFISVIFIFVNIPQFGFGSSIYYKNLLTAYPEGVLFFILIQSLILIYYKKFFFGGFLLAFAIFLRPNFIPFVFIVIIAQTIILLNQKNIKYFLKLFVGFSFVLLIPLHNYVFGKNNFYFLTSSTGITSNKVLSINDYFEVFLYKKTNKRILNHIKTFLNTGIDKSFILIINSFLLLNFLLFFIIFYRKYSREEKILFFASLFQILPSLFYINTGRFAIVLWFFIFICNLIILKFFLEKKVLKIN